MRGNRSSCQTYVRVVIPTLLVALGMWYWAIHLYAPQNMVTAIASGRPVGNNSDLYARWLGAREALLRGADPYSAEMTTKIQQGFYGRKLDPRSSNDALASESFTYPLYVIFVLAPAIAFPFSAVTGVFRWLLLLCIAGAVPLWMNSLGVQRGWLVKVSGMVLAVSTIPAVQEYFQQNLAALVIFLLAAATAAIAKNRLLLSGICLALATIKPDISAIFVLWYLLWAAGDWRKRRRLAWSFGVSLAILVIAAEAISPRWIKEFLLGLRQYKAHDFGPSILEAILPSAVALFLAVAILCGLVFVCWKSRKKPAGSEQFGLALALVSSAAPVLLPASAVYNQFLLIPAFILFIFRRDFLFGGWSPRWNAPRVLANAAIICQAWQWTASLFLSTATIFLTMPRLRVLIPLPCYTLYALVPLTFIAIGLYYLRSFSAIRA